jgi:hypothetical protein
MDRLHHLEKTLPVNLLSCSSYPECEFVVLNYGSKDGMDSWMRNKLGYWIKKGIVKYYRTQLPKHYISTHAKNIAHKQATGDILCNLDADNFIIEGYPEYLVKAINLNSVVVSPSRDVFEIDGSCGKIAVKKEHFYNVGGYDESLNSGWGWDDVNFQFRTRMKNNLIMIEADKKFCRVIEHSDTERAKNYRNKNIIETERISIDLMYRIEKEGDYVANKNQNWGFAEDLEYINHEF